MDTGLYDTEALSNQAANVLIEKEKIIQEQANLIEEKEVIQEQAKLLKEKEKENSTDETSAE